MRDCGPCQMCCTLPAIPALNKPAGQPCVYAVDGRCIRYETRPDACRWFECLWLEGFGREAERPDRAQAMLWLKGKQVVVHEATPGAGIALQETVTLLHRLGHPITVLSGGKTTLYRG